MCLLPTSVDEGRASKYSDEVLSSAFRMSTSSHVAPVSAAGPRSPSIRTMAKRS